MTGRYHAPFAEQGSHPVDADIADRLLRIALDKGGDYADLFFEYSVSGSYVYDEQILKSARRAVSMGLRVRVMKGDATTTRFSFAPSVLRALSSAWSTPIHWRPLAPRTTPPSSRSGWFAGA